MKEICTKDAVGSVLCHDITQIIKDEKNKYNSISPLQSNSSAETSRFDILRLPLDYLNVFHNSRLGFGIQLFSTA